MQIPYNPNHNKTQAYAIMQAFRVAQIEVNPVAQLAALRAALSCKVTNWERN